MPYQIPQAKYDALVEAYRQLPGVYRTAARKAGVDKETAKTGWLLGWPKRGFPPIKDVIAGEQYRARATLETQRREAEASEAFAKKAEAQALAAIASPPPGSPPSSERTAAEHDAVAARVQEAQAVRQARSNAIGLMGVTARLLTGVLKLAKLAQDELEVQAQLGRVDPLKVSKLTNGLAFAVLRGAEAAHLSMQMERLWLGEPTGIIGHKALATDMGLDEVKKRLAAASTAVERAEKRGLTILAGGPQAGEKTGS